MDTNYQFFFYETIDNKLDIQSLRLTVTNDCEFRMANSH